MANLTGHLGNVGLIMHDTLYVPSHFHATVVTGTPLAFMALNFFLVAALSRRHLVLLGLAKWQPNLFGLAIAGVSLFMMGDGTLGIPRRHWDIDFTDAMFSFDVPATAYLMLGLNGIVALYAAVGDMLFIVIMVGAILFGKRFAEAAVKPAPEPVAAAAGRYAAPAPWRSPGPSC